MVDFYRCQRCWEYYTGKDINIFHNAEGKIEDIYCNNCMKAKKKETK